MEEYIEDILEENDSTSELLESLDFEGENLNKVETVVPDLEIPGNVARP